MDFFINPHAALGYPTFQGARYLFSCLARWFSSNGYLTPNTIPASATRSTAASARLSFLMSRRPQDEYSGQLREHSRQVDIHPGMFASPTTAAVAPWETQKCPIVRAFRPFGT